MLESKKDIKNVASFQSLLKKNIFLKIWASFSLFQLFYWLFSFEAGWLISQQTDSPSLIASVQLFISLPVLLFTLIAGVFADKFSRRNYLILFNCILLFLCILFYFFNLLFMNVNGLLAFFLFFGCLFAFIMPAFQSFYADVLTPQERPVAVSLHGISFNVMRISSPILGAYLLSLSGTTLLLLLNIGLIFLILALLVIYLRDYDLKKSVSMLQSISLKKQFSIIFNSTKFKKIQLINFCGCLAISLYWSLLPYYARQLGELSGFLNLKVSLASLMSTLGVGCLLAMAIMPKLKKILDEKVLFIIPILLLGLSLILLSQETDFYLAHFGSLLLGCGWGLLTSIVILTTQNLFEIFLRAKAISIMTMVLYAGLSFGSFLWGSLSEYILLNNLLLIVGILNLAFSILLSLYVKIKFKS